MDIEVHVEIVVQRKSGDMRAIVQAFVRDLAGDEDAFLNVVDFLLSRLKDRDEIQRLTRVLDEAGSVWTPGLSGDHRYWELQERVEDALQATYTSAASARDNASTHLSRAWSEAFRRDPNASAAYDEAVKALEAAFQPIVLPSDATATLGKVVSAVNDKPVKFATALDGKGDGPEGVLAVVSSLNLIWRTQVRHGSGTEGAPTTVTIEQARDAVGLAASLIQMVRQGGFRLAKPVALSATSRQHSAP